MTRSDGRTADAIRSSRITPDFLQFAGGSVLMELGKTRVVCAASLEERVPPWLKGRGEGWLTAEYAMLPASTTVRSPRESSRGKVGGRTHEIQRLIGRSLRAVTDLSLLGERQVTIDCDVLQADGGTRTASITGAFVALVMLCRKLKAEGSLTTWPIRDTVAAVSVGIVAGQALLDLDYAEDSRADVDMNIVMTGSGRFIEFQGTAERHPFDREQLDGLIGLARTGIDALIRLQSDCLGERV